MDISADGLGPWFVLKWCLRECVMKGNWGTDRYTVVGWVGENSTHFFQNQWTAIRSTLSQFKNSGATPNQDTNMSEWHPVLHSFPWPCKALQGVTGAETLSIGWFLPIIHLSSWCRSWSCWRERAVRRSRDRALLLLLSIIRFVALNQSIKLSKPECPKQF